MKTLLLVEVLVTVPKSVTWVLDLGHGPDLRTLKQLLDKEPVTIRLYNKE